VYENKRLTGFNRKLTVMNFLSKFPQITTLIGYTASLLANREGVLAFVEVSSNEEEVPSFVETVLIPFQRKGISFYLEISQFKAHETPRKYRFSILYKRTDPGTSNQNLPAYYAFDSDGHIILKEKSVPKIEIHGVMRVDQMSSKLLKMVLDLDQDL